MLDAFLPEPRLVEIDHVDLAASPVRVYETIRHLDGARSPLVAALFSLRTAADRLSGKTHEAPSLRLDELGKTQPGFCVLADEPGHGCVAGAVGRFWEASIPFVAITPETFATYAEPGVAKVAWCLRAEPRGDDGARLIFELRVTATDEAAWHAVRRYFHLIGHFSRFIRRHLLSLVAAELGSLDEAERTRALPGDELIAEAKAEVTHHVDIGATAAEIWPWLVQMGRGRAGFYSYDWLDNGGQPSADEILPELQSLTVGDVIPLVAHADSGFEVLVVHRDRALVLGAMSDLDTHAPVPFASPAPERFWRVTWSFALRPLGERETRLSVRARVDFGSAEGRVRRLLEARVHDFMERAQLRHLKERAEGRPRQSWRDTLDGVVGAAGIVLDLATPFMRDARSRWGLDEAEADRAFPGDERVPAPRWAWTHAVEIDAPPNEVWPWVAQVGQDRGGFYSYQWLENVAGCEIRNASRIHDEWQHPERGDRLRMHPRMPPLTIVDVDHGHYLLACSRPDESSAERVSVSWLFLVEGRPGGKSRFVSRFRLSYEGDAVSTRLAYGPYVTESIGFVMDRRMLLGVRERVMDERRRRATASAAPG